MENPFVLLISSIKVRVQAFRSTNDFFLLENLRRVADEAMTAARHGLNQVFPATEFLKNFCKVQM